jgi:putative Holliday junction resolvase
VTGAGTGRVAAFDFGDRRIGVAVSDPTATIAEGRETIVRSGHSVPWRAILGLLEESGAVQVVVGDPIHLDGTAGERALLAREFAEEVGRRSGLPVAMQDERLTSVQAQRALIETRPGRGKKRRKGRVEDVDRVAAVLILQAWLDGRAGRAGREREDEPEEGA